MKPRYHSLSLWFFENFPQGAEQAIVWDCLGDHQFGSLMWPCQRLSVIFKMGSYLIIDINGQKQLTEAHLNKNNEEQKSRKWEGNSHSLQLPADFSFVEVDKKVLRLFFFLVCCWGAHGVFFTTRLSLLAMRRYFYCEWLYIVRVASTLRLCFVFS